MGFSSYKAQALRLLPGAPLVSPRNVGAGKAVHLGENSCISAGRGEASLKLTPVLASGDCYL